MIEPAAAIEALGLELLKPAVSPAIGPVHGSSFAEMLRAGVDATSAKLSEADRLVAAFVVDDTIPAHKVTFALEEARLSLELMLQIRNRFVEGYQQIMNMQV